MTIGVLLCALGFISYWFWSQLGGDRQSPTALIPAGFGVLLLLLGFGCLIKPAMRKHFMHAAVGLEGSHPFWTPRVASRRPAAALLRGIVRFKRKLRLRGRRSA